MLTPRIVDDTIPPVKLLSFRQWVACVAIVAVLCNMAVPFGFCWCEGCRCENHISRLFTHSTVEDKKCCCPPTEPLPEENCCGSPKTPCSCGCDDVQKEEAVVPKAVLPIKTPKIIPSWNIVSVLSVDFPNVSRAFLLGNHQVLLPPHVPLHVLLCVFLN